MPDNISKEVKQMISLLIVNTADGELGAVQIQTMLYFAELDHIRETKQRLTNLTYTAMNNGVGSLDLEHWLLGNESEFYEWRPIDEYFTCAGSDIRVYNEPNWDELSWGIQGCLRRAFQKLGKLDASDCFKISQEQSVWKDYCVEGKPTEIPLYDICIEAGCNEAEATEITQATHDQS